MRNGGGVVRPTTSQAETGSSFRRHPLSVCEQSSSRGTKQETGAHILLTARPSVWTCTCCRAGLWSRGDTGGGPTVGPSLRCPFAQIEVRAFTHTWLLVFTCVYRLSSHTPACLLSSSTRFLFPMILATVTDLAPLFSLCPPLLLPSILQMSVGSRTISRGSR